MKEVKATTGATTESRHKAKATEGLVTRAKAYSYVRMSTPDQLKGDSRRRQIALAEKYAEDRELDLMDRFDDWGVSAYRGRNYSELSDLRRFLTLAESGDIESGSYLIVESMDRLSRQEVPKALSILTDIMNFGVTLVTLDDGQEYSRETVGKNTYQLIIALGAMTRAHEESRRKSALLANAWEEKRRKARDEGVTATSKIPAWLRIDPQTKKIVAIPERAATVNEIFELTRDGWGAYSLSRMFNQRGEKAWGIPRKRSGASVWRESYIKKILTSRTVLGEYQPHRIDYGDKGRKRVPDGAPILDYYPQVIDPKLFDDARVATSSRRQTARGRKGSAYSNLFTGILQCSCGAGYRYIDKGEKSRGGPYLRCSVAHANGPCKATALNYHLVEATVLKSIEMLDVARVLGQEARNVRLREKNSDLGMLEIEKAACSDHMERVMEIIAPGNDLSSSRLGEKIHELEMRKREIEGRISVAKLEIGEILLMNPEVRLRAIERLLDEIRLAGDRAPNVIARRRLAEELRRLIEGIEIAPHVRFAWEIVDEDPNWMETYRVGSHEELEEALALFPFDLRVRYRSGSTDVVDVLTGVYLKLKGNRRMADLRYLTREWAGSRM